MAREEKGPLQKQMTREVLLLSRLLNDYNIFVECPGIARGFRFNLITIICIISAHATPSVGFSSSSSSSKRLNPLLNYCPVLLESNVVTRATE